MYYEHYRESRVRSTELVSAIGEILLAQRVPACPHWTILELLAHEAGMAADFATGSLTDWPTDAQANAQVSARSSATVAELTREWHEHSDGAEAKLRAGQGAFLMHDVLCHEADLRGALRLGRPPRDAWGASLNVLMAEFDRRTDAGRLVIHTEDMDFEAGSGEPVTTLEVSAYELWRGMLGRRSRQQLASWSWLPGPGRYPVSLPIKTPVTAELAEPA